MSKDSKSTFPGTETIGGIKGKSMGTIRSGPILQCLKSYEKSGDICYFENHHGHQLRAVVVKVLDIVGEMANIIVDFILDTGEKVRGYIERYNSGLLLSRCGMIGTYYHICPVAI